MRNFILADLLRGAESKLSESIALKRGFLNHQKRDLTACWPSERVGRKLEIEALEAELSEMLDARSELDALILRYS